MVPDNVLELESDASSSETERSGSANDTDVQMGGTVPEDVENLNINMRPQYSCNARELAGRKGKRKMPSLGEGGTALRDEHELLSMMEIW